MTKLQIGTRIRPEGGILTGTLGCLAVNASGDTCLITCDHVLKTIYTPAAGPWNIHLHLNARHDRPVAIYRGNSLAEDHIADLATAVCLPPVENHTKLPAPLPGSHVDRITGITEPAPGMNVYMWGAISNTYISGTVLTHDSNDSWPHPQLGNIQWKLQFPVSVGQSPLTGDSGGPVLSHDGKLAGFICGRRTEHPADTTIYCVPASPCLPMLGVSISFTC